MGIRKVELFDVRCDSIDPDTEAPCRADLSDYTEQLEGSESEAHDMVGDMEVDGWAAVDDGDVVRYFCPIHSVPE